MTNPQRSADEIMNSAQLAPALGRLPNVSAEGISGFMEILQNRQGRPDLYEIARDLQLSTDELLPLADAAQWLGFINLTQGDVTLTDTGRKFAQADILERKRIFRDRVVATVPLAQSIHKALAEQRRHTLPEEFFEDILDEHFSENDAVEQLRTITDWGRYAELFEYDATRKVFTLSEPEALLPPAPPPATPTDSARPEKAGPHLPPEMG